MKKVGVAKTVTIFVFSLIFLLETFNFVYADSNSTLQPNGTMTVSANIIGFRINPSLEGVGIEVPDYVDLGNVTNNTLVSNEVTVYINNTGTVDVTVTPQLADENEGIFSYLFFRSFKTSSDPEKNQYYKIGDYSLDISKPSTGSISRSGHCYMRLNLTEFNAPINQDLISHHADVIFYAMPSS